MIFGRVAVLFLVIGGIFGEAQAAKGNQAITLREAETALDSRQYDRVLQLVEPLTRDDSNGPEFHRLKVRALARTNHPIEALREYARLEVKVKRDDEPLLREVAVSFITAVLKDMREQMRGAGYTALKELESDEAIPYFEDGLNDGSGLVRTLAAEGLSRLNKGRQSLRLRQALEDQAAMVRAAVLKGLGRSGDRTTIPLIEKHLTDEQPIVRVAARGALVRLGRKEARGALREAAKAPNPDERGGALRMLGELRDRESSGILEQGLNDAQPSVRGAAISGLAELGEAGAGSVIERLLTDPIPAVRAAAAVSLGEVQAKQSIAALKRALTDSNPAVRAAAIDGLLHIGLGFDELSVTVRELINSTDPGIRASAAKALARSKAGASKDAMDVLQILLSDPLPRPRIAAARAIGHLAGPDRAELIMILKRSLTDQDEAVRATGAGALGKLLSGSVAQRPSQPE